jgi:hypothetical protein
MSVTDFECAIAKSQIGRYIAGDNLEPEIARQLESHINNCARCKELLQEKKSSLEAIIVNNDESIKIATNPVPMSSGSPTQKPDYMEVLADSARKSLREKLKESTKINTDVVEIPAVASAFAYKDAEEVETIQLKVPTPEVADTKKNGFLSALALFKDVPDESPKPAMTMNNIRAAKAVIRDNDPSMRKPAMYLAGLCVVVAAMSFVLRDPTTLFGGKVATKGSTVNSPTKKVTKKPATNVAKLRPHRQIQLNEKGTDAQGFTNKPAPKAKLKSSPALKPTIKSTKIAKPTPVAKSVVKKKPIVAQPTTTSTRVKKTTPKVASHAKPSNMKGKVQAQKFVANSKPKTQPRPPIAKKPRKKTENENAVKLYTPDSTPQSQEQP